MELAADVVDVVVEVEEAAAAQPEPAMSSKTVAALCQTLLMEAYLSPLSVTVARL
ncbi:MAG TPA: hypothetical protein VGM78_16625 [Ilumatobacteraceae bacterium]